MTRLLEMESVTAGYGETTVLREASCSVPAGAIVALIGANGAGSRPSCGSRRACSRLRAVGFEWTAAT